ncbi:hypothetical protein BpHYR1_041301 [Brachionus plicatilis]|uniref:Uncharacterized protein n=1 Tax=Brachionus plicatilis TaxID=10195 RepID=A0A3M7R5P1_BRAPC|nr:hypothetical protein BpHYR1_041301 [Brachionus plicatilis]
MKIKKGLKRKCNTLDVIQNLRLGLVSLNFLVLFLILRKESEKKSFSLFSGSVRIWWSADRRVSTKSGLLQDLRSEDNKSIFRKNKT